MRALLKLARLSVGCVLTHFVVGIFSFLAEPADAKAGLEFSIQEAGYQATVYSLPSTGNFLGTLFTSTSAPDYSFTNLYVFSLHEYVDGLDISVGATLNVLNTASAGALTLIVSDDVSSAATHKVADVYALTNSTDVNSIPVSYRLQSFAIPGHDVLGETGTPVTESFSSIAPGFSELHGVTQVNYTNAYTVTDVLTFVPSSSATPGADFLFKGETAVASVPEPTSLIAWAFMGVFGFGTTRFTRAKLLW